MTFAQSQLPFDRPIGFRVEWFDTPASLVREYRLTYNPDRTLQLNEVKNNKKFLGKTFCPDVSPSDLFVGGSVTIFSRELHIVDYADISSRTYLQSLQSRGFMMILPSAFANLGQDGSSVVGIEFVIDSRRGGFQGWLKASAWLREMYGDDDGGGQEHGIFTPTSPAEAEEHSKVFFGNGLCAFPPATNLTPDTSRSGALGGTSGGGGRTVAAVADLGGKGNNGRESAIATGGAPRSFCTLCLVKPHVVRSGGLGTALLEIARGGFQVTGMEMLSMDARMAEEFFSAYRDVLPGYSEALEQVTSGPMVALQVQGGSNVVEEFRELCGPTDPEVAQTLRPGSLRAQLGIERATNAVHCTDLPEDGLLECQHVFGVLNMAARPV